MKPQFHQQLGNNLSSSAVYLTQPKIAQKNNQAQILQQKLLAKFSQQKSQQNLPAIPVCSPYIVLVYASRVWVRQKFVYLLQDSQICYNT